MICPSYIVPMLSIALIVGGTLLTRYGLNCDRDLLMVIGWLSVAAATIVLTIWGIDHLPVPAYTSAKLTCSRPIAFITATKNVAELPLHYVELSPEYDGSYDPNTNKRKGEQADSPRPASHHPFIDWMLCGVFFGATAAAVFVAFKSTEYADDHGAWWWWAPFLVFLSLAFFLADHAIGYSL